MILVYSKEISPRLEYTVRLLFHDILRSEATLTNDPVFFRNSDFPKVNYSDKPFEDELFLKADSLLFSGGIELPDIQPVKYKNETGFFHTSPDSFLPFDPFSSAFLMVSRMEEYQPGPRDKHNRFPAENSVLYRYGLLETPVVNHWARLVASALEKKYGQTLFPEGSFTFLPTIDVDNAWAYLHKGLFRNLASLSRDLFTAKYSEIIKRFKVLKRPDTDPYDTYERLCRHFRGNESKVVFFFLLGDYARFDKQVSWKNGAFRKLITETAQRYSVGIHPSWRSSELQSSALVKREKERLEGLISAPVIRSRQHYLRLSFPETYRQLIKAGITEDYSMGFPELPGFRAGICSPFFFYDLIEEQTTSLKIFPFQIMEVTFAQYLGYNAEETIDKITTLMDSVRSVDGTFCSIWHNESLSGEGRWEGFPEIFGKMIDTGFSYEYKI